MILHDLIPATAEVARASSASKGWLVWRSIRMAEVFSSDAFEEGTVEQQVKREQMYAIWHPDGNRNGCPLLWTLARRTRGTNRDEIGALFQSQRRALNEVCQGEEARKESFSEKENGTWATVKKNSQKKNSAVTTKTGKGVALLRPIAACKQISFRCCQRSRFGKHIINPFDCTNLLGDGFQSANPAPFSVQSDICCAFRHKSRGSYSAQPSSRFGQLMHIIPDTFRDGLPLQL